MAADLIDAEEAHALTLEHQRELVIQEIKDQRWHGKFSGGVPFAISRELEKELEDKGYYFNNRGHYTDISWETPRTKKTAFNQ